MDLMSGMTASAGLQLALLGTLLLLLLPPLVDRLLRRWGRLEQNFRGDRIPQSYGLVILIWSTAMLSTALGLLPRIRALTALWLIACAGFGLLGLVDDWWGIKAIKGLRGHFRTAFRDRVITTGLIKAVGGTLIALLLGWQIGHNDTTRSLLAAGVIALTANAINLLDLRPGRASSVFLITALPLLALCLHLRAPIALPLLLIIAPTVLVWKRDASAQVMMGDTGSNLLGACLGLAVAQLCNMPGQCLVLALLVSLHVLSERVSLTRLIENNRLLRALDRLTGVR